MSDGTHDCGLAGRVECDHDWVYTPDPSGNNDGLRECRKCGVEMSKASRARTRGFGDNDSWTGPSVTDQPTPTRVADSRDVEPVLVDLIRQRTALGRSRYGTQLQTHNGRDCRVDALQEALDLSQYLMQRVMELEDQVRWLKAARGSPDLAREVHS